MILDESDVLVPLVGSSSKTRDHGVKDGVSWLLSGAILGEKRSPKYEASADCDVVASSPKLPLLTTDTDCREVFLVSYWLRGNDMKLKNRQFWKLKKYWKAEFYFVVKIGLADLRF